MGKTIGADTLRRIGTSSKDLYAFVTAKTKSHPGVATCTFKESNRKYLTNIILGFVDLPLNGTCVWPEYQKLDERSYKHLKTVLQDCPKMLSAYPPKY